MDYTIENVAPSTETSPLSSLIPPLHSSPLPPPNSTLPQSPLNKEPLCNAVINRQILQPIPPSKRTAPTVADSDITSHTNDEENYDSHLPHNFAAILAARKRQEKALNTRLMICTSFISGIESTVANFQDGDEKAMANELQTYLDAAISEFAAVDITPPLPKYKPNSKTGNGTGKSHANLPKKPVLIATPLRIPITQVENGTITSKSSKNPLPNKPQNTEKPWSTVVRNGHYKSRSTVTPDKQSGSTVKPATQTAQSIFKPLSKENSSKKETSSNTQDQRLFIRLTSNHEWRKLSPAGVREVIVKLLSISPASIGTIKPVRSGFALTPRDNTTRQELLRAGIRLVSSDAKLEAATNWIPVMVPTVPVSIQTVDGRVEITKEILADEIERVSSVRPATLKLYGRNLPNAPHRTWMAYFSKAPRPGFRVFDESGRMRKFKTQQRLDFCKRCNGHHSPKNCSRAPSCGNCGSTMHPEDLCMALTKCKNCGGPHRSDSHKCLARPTRSGLPTKEQLKIFRQAGDREFQAVARAKAAEERAAAVEETIELTSSQPELMPNSTSQASSVDIPTEDAMRL